MNRILLTAAVMVLCAAGCVVSASESCPKPEHPNLFEELVQSVDTPEFRASIRDLTHTVQFPLKRSRLSWAAVLGELDTVRAILLSEVVPESELIQAMGDSAYVGRLESVMLFLERGVPVNAAGDDGVTALMSAAQSGQLDVMAELIARGASVNAKDLYGNDALFGAVAAHQLEAIRFLLERGADPCSSGPTREKNAYWLATRLKNACTARLLLPHASQCAAATANR